VKVKMNIWISGTRNGVPWPAVGQVVDLPDVEAVKLCASGQASAVAEDVPPVETAVAEDDSEKRGPLTTKRVRGS
jgi:hypothetical protein